MTEKFPSEPSIIDADFSEVMPDEVPCKYRPCPPSPSEPPSKFYQWLLNIAVCAGLAWLLFTFVPGHIEKRAPSPQAMQARKELDQKIRIEQRTAEIQHETEFWKSHSEIPIIAQVIAPDGKTYTGHILFVPDCPKGNWCAQPDGRITDEDGDDALAAEAKAEEDYYEQRR